MPSALAMGELEAGGELLSSGDALVEIQHRDHECHAVFLECRLPLRGYSLDQ